MTAVNPLVGARSQLAEVVTAAITRGTMLLLAPFIGLMPHATLAAIVIVYSMGLIKPSEFRAVVAVHRFRVGADPHADLPGKDMRRKTPRSKCTLGSSVHSRLIRAARAALD